jgi:hypothetical protein
VYASRDRRRLSRLPAAREDEQVPAAAPRLAAADAIEREHVRDDAGVHDAWARRERRQPARAGGRARECWVEVGGLKGREESIGLGILVEVFFDLRAHFALRRVLFVEHVAVGRIIRLVLTIFLKSQHFLYTFTM